MLVTLILGSVVTGDGGEGADEVQDARITGQINDHVLLLVLWQVYQVVQQVDHGRCVAHLRQCDRVVVVVREELVCETLGVARVHVRLHVWAHQVIEVRLVPGENSLIKLLG